MKGERPSQWEEKCTC